MTRLRSILSVALISALGATAWGCKEEPPPLKAEPEAAPKTSAASVSTKGRVSLRSTSPMPKVDPQTMKEYRSELCYVGTLTLRQARDAYLASLGKNEPSEKHIPSFGTLPTPKTTPAAATPPGKAGAPAPAGADPKTAAPKTAAPSTSVAAGTSATPPHPVMPRGPLPMDLKRPGLDMAMRAPHERNARACTAAAAMKAPAMPGVDEALAELAPFAVQLAKTVVTASAYYQREEFKGDKFAKGKELHKKLVEDFQKFQELSDKLGVATDAWRAGHPIDPAGMEEGEKLTMATFADARALFLALLPTTIDAAAYKAAIAKLEASTEALKQFGKDNPIDPWSKIMTPTLDAYLRTAKGAEEKLGPKGLEPDTFLTMVTGFTSVIESKHRSLTRALIAKQRAAKAAGDEGAVPNDPASAPAIPQGADAVKANAEEQE